MRQLLHGRNAVFVGVGIAAVCIAVVLIALSVVGSSGKKAAPAPTASSTPTGPSSFTPLPGTASTRELFHGIPQKLNVLGNANAPVTMIEFADLQCPFCRDYGTDALPALVKTYVRTGKAKFVFSGLRFIGPDSEKALRAVYAAGIQGNAWEFLDLLYKNQGLENEGWVTDALLRSIAMSIPGFDASRMLADMSSSEVTNAVAASDEQASRAHVNATPTFFAGRTGGTLQQLAVSKLTPAALERALAPIVE
jgi:protein-disulfide isomerase